MIVGPSLGWLEQHTVETGGRRESEEVKKGALRKSGEKRMLRMLGY